MPRPDISSPVQVFSTCGVHILLGGRLPFYSFHMLYYLRRGSRGIQIVNLLKKEYLQC